MGWAKKNIVGGKLSYNNNQMKSMVPSENYTFIIHCTYITDKTTIPHK